MVAGRHMINSSRCLVCGGRLRKRGLLPALRFFSVFVGVLSRALDWTRPAFWSPLQGAQSGAATL